MTTLKTLLWQSLAQRAPEVSFVTEFPGLVLTPIFSKIGGWLGVAFQVYTFLLGWLLAVPLDECAARHVFMATSAAFPPPRGESRGVPLVGGAAVRSGVDGVVGSGVYSVGWDNEGPTERVVALLKGYHSDGTATMVWNWLQDEFTRVLKTPV